MISQTANRIHVTRVRLNIMANEITIPRIGTRGTIGVRNGRASSGLRRRRIHTPAQTMTKASKVPMLTISVSTSIGRDAASTATNMPTVSVEIQGVRKRRWTALNMEGSKRSRDMEKNTRDYPSSMTTIVLVRPMSAPSFTSKLPQPTPVESMPIASGSGTFKFL